MLNSNSSKNIDPQKETTLLNTWLAIVIVVVVAIIAGVIILKFASNTNKNNSGESLTESQNVKKVKTEVHSYSGIITKINPDNLIMQSSANKNYLKQDTELTVNFNEQTQFITLSIPQQLTGSPIKDQIKRETVDKKDLKVGQNIFVMSQENIIDKTTFTASKIEIQIIK